MYADSFAARIGVLAALFARGICMKYKLVLFLACVTVCKASAMWIF